MKNIGIDIGGYKIFSALVDEKGKIHKSIKINTPKNREKLLHRIEDIVFALSIDEKIKGIGIGIPGVLDEKKEKMIFSPNLIFLNNWNVKKAFEKKIKKKIVLENDANCFAFAVSKLEAKKTQNFGVLTLGTGIGCGLILNGFLFTGKARASEAGHSKILYNKKIVCFEDLIGTKGIIKRAKKVGIKIKNVFELEEKAKKSTKARKIIKETGNLTGLLVANLFDILDLEKIFLTGGLINLGPLLVENIKKTTQKNSFIKTKKEVIVSKLGEEAGAIGAALLSIKKS